ncbi:ribosome quality control complex subunit NEMF homolog [Bacillus rossius redtenbacheri]|uniref:ribosome quality control complex subunit NEMF homolog n=1 Tax=Bacillus rossius redtenbacheri TaxID=93214 RepID=UPI002FDDF1E5
MKTRFNTYDLACCVTELQRLIGMRVAQVYDIDHKTYLIRLQKPEEKAVLLLESGVRIHTTAFEWPKNVAPSGFSMKMRKHLRNKRLESARQLGTDRIVDLQFGSGEAAYHVVLELYDRGNIVLTDCQLTILNILRPHTEGEQVRFAVREKYPTDRARQKSGAPAAEDLQKIFSSAKPGEGLKKILNPHLEYGPAIIDHVLLKAGFPPNCKLGKGFDPQQDMPRLCAAMEMAEDLMSQAAKQASKGYIIQKKEKRPRPDGTEEDFFSNQEFHPMVFEQHSSQPFQEFPSFDAAVDEFFSQMESQKIDMKTLQIEKDAVKKLENVRKDHDQRLVALGAAQAEDVRAAELITRNRELVDNAVLAVRSALANQLAWPDIQNLVDEARGRGDPVAARIARLKLAVNSIVLQLSDPYAEDDTSDIEPMLVDIDLDLTAYANARKYYDKKRTAAKKQQKTVESQGKALKSAEKKTKQTLKEVQVISSINKARKVYWFEKFFWFISSENYLVIGGRDQQQNELIVKRYMKAGDIYVHADISGASSVTIKNPSGEPVPPKTLNEAGVMAVCYSVAWEAKVLTSAWWVHSDQVSKTAPTGEYLTTGSFMIRGKKNYLLPSHLIMGFGFLFRLADESAFRHKDERKVRTIEDDAVSMQSSNDLSALLEQDEEIELDDTDEEHVEQNEAAKDEAVEKNAENPELSDPKEPQDKEDGSESSDSQSANEESSDEDGSENPKKVHFPDTEVKIAVDSSNQIVLKTKSTSLMKSSVQDTSEHVVYLGDDKPVILKPSANLKQKKPANKAHGSHKNTHTEEEQTKQANKDDSKSSNLKRGQKSKLKKIKEKYKDQDEDERKLIMDILQAGSGKETRKSKKVKEQLRSKSSVAKGDKKAAGPRPKPAQPRAEGVDPDEGEGAEEEVTVNTDTDMLDLLTAVPVPEDELLFAVPVIAPYNVLLGYKYKVKLTPGTGKRGKAARTAVNMFLKERGATQRERDLLRSVKDETLARNLPGKVKLSAPQLKKLHK